MKQQNYDMPAAGRKGIGIKSKIPLQDIIIEEAGPVPQTPSRTNGPIEVVRDSQTGKYHLFDGQQRVREAMKRGETSIVALVAKGNPVDGGGWNISKGEFEDAGISDASNAITTSGIFKYNELIKAGKSSDVAYAQARAANNQAFTKFLETLDWKRPKNANPNIPDIEYMRNDPTIGDIVGQAEKARELGNRRLFVWLNMDSRELIKRPCMQSSYPSSGPCFRRSDGRYWRHDTQSISHR